VDTYVVHRRSGWANTDELKEAADRSKSVADEHFPDDIKWIRSYVVPEDDGRLGTACIYQASGEQAIRDHAAKADLPVTEIKRSISTVIMRPDPDE
jgi:hypothetical protein